MTLKTSSQSVNIVSKEFEVTTISHGCDLPIGESNTPLYVAPKRGFGRYPRQSGDLLARRPGDVL